MLVITKKKMMVYPKAQFVSVKRKSQGGVVHESFKEMIPPFPAGMNHTARRRMKAEERRAPMIDLKFKLEREREASKKIKRERLEKKAEENRQKSAARRELKAKEKSNG